MKKALGLGKRGAAFLLAAGLLTFAGCGGVPSQESSQGIQGSAVSQEYAPKTAALGETIEVKDSDGKVAYRLTIESVEPVDGMIKDLLGDLNGSPQAVAIRYSYENVDFDSQYSLLVDSASFQVTADGEKAVPSNSYLNNDIPRELAVGESCSATAYFGVSDGAKELSISFGSNLYPGNDVILEGIQIEAEAASSPSGATYQSANAISFLVTDQRLVDGGYFMAAVQMSNQGENPVEMVVCDVSFLDSAGNEVGSSDGLTEEGLLEPGKSKILDVMCSERAEQVSQTEVSRYSYQLVEYDQYGYNYYEVDTSLGKASAGVIENYTVNIQEEISQTPEEKQAQEEERAAGEIRKAAAAVKQSYVNVEETMEEANEGKTWRDIDSFLEHDFMFQIDCVAVQEIKKKLEDGCELEEVSAFLEEMFGTVPATIEEAKALTDHFLELSGLSTGTEDFLALMQGLSKMETVEGTFDFEKEIYLFEIPDMKAFLEEAGLSAKTFGEMVAMTENKAPTITFTDTGLKFDYDLEKIMGGS